MELCLSVSFLEAFGERADRADIAAALAAHGAAAFGTLFTGQE